MANKKVCRKTGQNIKFQGICYENRNTVLQFHAGGMKCFYDIAAMQIIYYEASARIGKFQEPIFRFRNFGHNSNKSGWMEKSKFSPLFGPAHKIRNNTFYFCKSHLSSSTEYKTDFVMCNMYNIGH